MLWIAAMALLSPAAKAFAPMCDPTGATVAAPAPAPPASSGDWAAARGCPDSKGVDSADATRHDRPGPSAERAIDPPDRVQAVTRDWPAPMGARAPQRFARPGRPLPGFSDPVYHPPEQ